jgi:hypothetical protein
VHWQHRLCTFRACGRLRTGAHVGLPQHTSTVRSSASPRAHRGGFSYLDATHWHMLSGTNGQTIRQ